MRDDFCALILTYKRPDNVQTLKSLRKYGYTGPIYLVVSDDDPTLDEYRKNFGDMVVTFSREESIADQCDNFPHKRGVLVARNMCHEIARSLGFKLFIEMDDDYKDYQYKLRSWAPLRNLDTSLSAMARFLENTSTLAVCLSQGGDHIGGTGNITLRRKAMNSFVCHVDRPFRFVGRLNDDVNTYVTLGSRGVLFFTYLPTMLNQKETQQGAGGLTDLYLDSGTYVKSFYTVMQAPSSVKVSYLRNRGDGPWRVHHSILWPHAVPKIVHESHRKT